MATIDMGEKRGAAVDSWDHVQYDVACAEVYFRTKWRVHPVIWSQ